VTRDKVKSNKVLWRTPVFVSVPGGASLSLALTRAPRATLWLNDRYFERAYAFLWPHFASRDVAKRPLDGHADWPAGDGRTKNNRKVVMRFVTGGPLPSEKRHRDRSHIEMQSCLEPCRL
jgi:hypothetical protein